MLVMSHSVPHLKNLFPKEIFKMIDSHELNEIHIKCIAGRMPMK